MLPKESADFSAIKESLIDRMLFGFACVVLIALAGSLSRISEIGFKPIMAFHVFLSLVFIVTYWQRRKICSAHKSYIIVGSLFLAGIAGLVNFGLAGAGTILLFAASLIACLIISTRAAIAVAVVGLLFQLWFLFHVTIGTSAFNVDLEGYITTPTAWFNNITSYIFLLGVTLFVVDRFFTYLTSISAVLQASVEEKTEQLDQSEVLLSSVINSLPFGVFWKDKKLKYLGCNTHFAKDVNLDSQSSVVGKTDYDLATIELAESYRNDDRQVMETGEAKLDIEETFVNEAGERKYIITNKVPLRNKQQEIIGLLGTYADITHLKTMEIDLRNAKEAAEEASEAKSNFLATMSHEIRTPINGVMGLLELVLTTELTEKQREFLLKAEMSAHTLLHVINQILDISKIEAGKMEIEHIPFSLVDIVEQIKSQMEYRAADKGLEFKIDLKGKAQSRVVGDPTKLLQILINLCSNAIKFTERGGVKVNIGALPKDDSLQLRISVSDTGIGISQEQQTHLFESFTQADNSITRKFGGTGLGLSIVKQLLELQSGTIEVKSEKGKGTTFTCFISYQLHDGKELAKADRDSADLSDVRILLVEDNHINQLIAQEMLVNEGASVTLAENGQESLDWLNKKEFDVVLMDIQMPVMDGTQALKAIRTQEQFETLPVIAMTANVLSHEVRAYEEMGFTDHLGKPFQREQLLTKIAEVLSAESVL